MADHAEFIATIAGPLGGYLVACAVLNVLAAAVGACSRSVGHAGRRWWLIWLAPGALFALLAGFSLAGRPWLLPTAVKGAVNSVFTPVTFTLGWMVMLVALYMKRRFFVRPMVAFGLLNVALLALGLAVTDRHFAAIVARPDNVAIVALLFLVGFFIWLAGWQAVANDRRLAAGKEPDEAAFDGKALTWPDLVYIELITTVLVTAGLIVWSILLKAPLEAPANPVLTPNPSKAPWYFVGLQEMLVYADPWYAGVVVPVLMFFGLIAIPYLDPNPEGNGYYTIDQRPFAFKWFLFGMLGLWVMLILVGTFMRGPNWTFFAPFEMRDPHLIVPHQNVSLSQYVWVWWLGGEMPEIPADAGLVTQTATILWREVAGLLALGLYFVALPWLLAVTWLKRLRQQMGRTRYVIMIMLLLVMFTLPLKMILRWTMNLSYLISIPEWYLSF